MSYAGRETSAADGSPVELYEFRRGGTVWRYTSAAQDVVYTGNTYSAAPISRSSIEHTTEMAKADLRVTVPRDIDVVQSYIASPPYEVSTLTIYRQHRGDAETVVVWMGRILGIEWRGAQAEIECEPVYTSMQRTGLRRLYQRACTHVLYGMACGVSAVVYRVAGTVASISGTTVSVPAAGGYAAGHFAGGYMTWPAAGITERRMIVSHSGSNITLATAPAGIVIGASVHLYPGCDHTLTTCNAKFANAANYGGFPFMPSKNPFGGGSSAF